MHKENKFQLLYEYLTVGQDSSNKLMQGEERPQAPKGMTLQDIMDTHGKHKDDDNSKAPDVLPSPLTNNHISVLADMYSNAANLKSDIKKASENPIIKDSDKLSSASAELYKKLEKVGELIKDMADDLDKFSIENQSI